MIIFIYNSSGHDKSAKKIPFTITSKRIKYLGLNSTKIQNFENYKTLWKKLKEINWKIFQFLGRFSIVKIT